MTSPTIRPPTRVAMATLAVSAIAPAPSVVPRNARVPCVTPGALSSRASIRAQSGASLLASQKASRSPKNKPRRRARAAPLAVRALVNIDLGPSAILGASVMVSAIGLYQVRASRPEVSRDQDVFFSSIGLLTGGILVFQGWRLDPLMLFGQLLTAGTAVSFASEAVGLRQEILDREAAEAMGRSDDGKDGRNRRYARRNNGGRDGGTGRDGGGAPNGSNAAPPRPLPPPRARRVNYRDQDVGTRTGGWDDAPNNWDQRNAFGRDDETASRGGPSSTRRNAPGEPWRQRADEYVFDASSVSPSSSVSSSALRGDSSRNSSENNNNNSNNSGGFMESFDQARGGGKREGNRGGREGRKNDAGNDDFGPARFGSEADDWEL